jgi:hypothetical protein
VKKLDDETYKALGVPLPEPIKWPEGMFMHTTPKPDACQHNFQGWREIKCEPGEGGGGETVCTKCGMGAMEYSLRCGP